MNKISEFVLYGLGLMLMLKGLDIRTFSPEFWYFIAGSALFSLSHDFRYKKVEE